MLGTDGITRSVVVENTVSFVAVRGKEVTEGQGRHRLCEATVVKEMDFVPFQGNTQVVGGSFIEASNNHIAFNGHVRIGLLILVGAKMHLLAGGLVDAGPAQDVQRHEMFSEKKVSSDLSIVSEASLDQESVQIRTILGDDVHHTGKCHAAVQGRCGASQHLYLLDFFQAYGEIRAGRIGRIAVEAVSVEHDEDFLLSGGIDASHGHVHLLVAGYVCHAGDIGHQSVFQGSGAYAPEHVFRDKGHRHRGLLNGFSLLGGRRNRSRLPHAEPVHHFHKTGDIIINPVVGIYCQEFANPGLGHLRLVHIQVAKGQEPEDPNPVLSAETAHRVAQERIGLGKPSEFVCLLGLFQQMRIFLGPDAIREEKDGKD